MSSPGDQKASKRSASEKKSIKPERKEKINEARIKDDKINEVGVPPRRSVRERTVVSVRDLLGIKTRKRKHVVKPPLDAEGEEEIERASPQRDEHQLLIDEDSADESEAKVVKSEKDEDLVFTVVEVAEENIEPEGEEQVHKDCHETAEENVEENKEAPTPDEEISQVRTLSGEEREAVASVIAECQDSSSADTVYIIQQAGESGKPIVLRVNGQGELDENLQSDLMETAITALNMKTPSRSESVLSFNVLDSISAEEEGEVLSYTVITEDPEVVRDEQMLQIVASISEEDQPSTSAVTDVVEDPENAEVLYAPITEQDICEVNPKTGRCKPSQHLVATSSLQSLINEIKADVDLSQHVEFCKNYNRGTMQCRHCKEMISNRHAFRAHMRTKHSDLQFKPFKCPLCDYRAEVKASVARHINVHSTHKPYACTVCGRGFAFKQKLQIHMKYHRNVRDQICPLCKMAFHEHNTLKTHLSNVHGLPKPGEFLQQMKNTKSLWKITPAHEKVEEEENLAASDVIKFVTAEELQQESQEEPPEEAQVLSFPVQTTSNMKEEITEESNAVLMPHSTKSVIKNTSKLEMRTKAYNQMKVISAVAETHTDSATLDPVEDNRPFPMVKSKATPLVSDHHLFMDTITKSDMNVNPPNKVFAKCKLCSSIMFCKSQFFTHIELNHPEIKAWGCPQCPYKSRGRPAMLTHLKIHIGKKIHKCSVCSKSFLHKHKLTSHMRIHENLRNVKCTMCPKAFNETNDLTKHIRQVHIGLRLFECERCGKKFKDSSQLRSHVHTHDLIKRAECEVCHKMYKSVTSLKQHMKGHACIFHCEICDRSFGSYSGFMAHKVMHDESRDYEGFECPKCDAVLLTKGSFNRHSKVVHSDIRRFSCEVCNSAFKSRKDLNNHCLIHLKDKRFKCSVCALPCRSAESLRVHMLRHADQKPYTCGLCGKHYTQKHALQMHLAHHNKGDKCLYCNTVIHNKTMMHAHMRTEHLDELERDSARTGETGPEAETTSAAVSAAGPDSQNPAEDVVTVYMCVECQNVSLNRAALREHMLEVHSIEHNEAETKDQFMTTESQVSISNPSGPSQRVVTLVHPVPEETQQKDDVVTFTDPNTNLQYIVPVTANTLLSGLTGNELESLEIENQQEKKEESVVVFEEVATTEEVKTSEKNEEVVVEEYEEESIVKKEEAS